METTRALLDSAHRRLSGVGAARGLARTETPGADVDRAFAPCVAAVERALARTLEDGSDVASAAARHIVASGGKRVRPMLCFVAAEAISEGARSSEAVRLVAAAAEAIHGSTLLHDDVIDEGSVRRGRPAARVVYGNAASVLGGDLLLVRALEMVERAGVPGLLPAALRVLARMIEAEALQLERRGSSALGLDEYFAIAAGKTGSLFEWAASGAARAASGGGAEDARSSALGRYGLEVGVAFQIADDLLDLTGAPEDLGKGVLSDVVEGKLTLPVVHALARDPSLGPLLEAASRARSEGDLTVLGRRIRAAVDAAGGVEAARSEIARRTRVASSALSELAPGAARDLLQGIASALAERSA